MQEGPGLNRRENELCRYIDIPSVYLKKKVQSKRAAICKRIMTSDSTNTGHQPFCFGSKREKAGSYLSFLQSKFPVFNKKI